MEIDRLGHSFCRIRIGGTLVKHSVHTGKVVNTDDDCGSLTAAVRPRFRARVSGSFRAPPTKDFGFKDSGNECRRAKARMNCSKTSHSARSQSFKVVLWRHPPAHQSACAHCSICSWILRCSSAVKTTPLTSLPGDSSFIWWNSVPQATVSGEPV
jgi:hypothetical protein